MFHRILNWVASHSRSHRMLTAQVERQRAIIANADKHISDLADKCYVHRQTLRTVVSSINCITTPNGTLRKIKRIASNALGA